jgi:subtilisin family serine protease
MSWSRISVGFVVCAGLALVGCSEPGTAPLDQGAAATEMAAPQFSQAKATGNGYMLVAGKWGEEQTSAVEAAGGTVVHSHAKTGIGTVTSGTPDFLERALATQAFADGFVDESVVWQEPRETIEFEPAVVTPGDEGFFGLQWNMWSIEAPAAWATGADGSGARVAVIDGGIYSLHADIAPNLDVGCSASFVPGQPYNSDTGTFWHGTHVAGIVLAADNGFGVIGVAPEATLMHVKALHSGSGSFSWIINAILFASDPASYPGYEGCDRADIINMSLGAVFPKSASRGFQAAITKAVNFAASRGVLVISAAGNDGLDLGQFRDWVSVPAQSGSGLAVSATGPVDFFYGGDDFRRFASYSNYGEDLVFVAAPGGDDTRYPVGPWYYDMVLSTCKGTSTPPSYSFCFADGTSMAAPAAAGVAALIVGKYPGIPLGKLKTMLKNSADDEGKKGKDQFYGHGFVNAYNAVK